MGVDVLPAAIEFAKKNVNELKQRGLDLRNIDFEHRNIFVPDIEERKW